MSASVARRTDDESEDTMESTRTTTRDTAPASGAPGRGARAARLGGLLIAPLFVLIWSSGYLVGSIGTRNGPPLALLFWRFGLALVAMLVIVAVTRAPWPRRARVWCHLLATGILLQTVQFGFLYIGLAQKVPASLASLLLSTCPLFVSAIAVPMFGERLRGLQWLGLVVGIVGVGLSLSGELHASGGPTGYLFTGLALAGFVAGTLYQKRFAQDTDLRTGTAIQLIGATVTSLPLALLSGSLALPWTAGAVGSVVWLALVNSIGAFTLLTLLLRRRSGAAATSLLFLVPPVTAILAVPLLGQGISVLVVVGMVVAGVGVLLVLTCTNKGRRASPPEAGRSTEEDRSDDR